MEYGFYWAIDENTSDPAAGCATALKNDIAKHQQKIHTFKGRDNYLDKTRGLKTDSNRFLLLKYLIKI